MVDKTEFDALIETFSAEAEEGLGEAEAALLRLERDAGDRESINVAFRIAHTIKGNAGMFDLGPVTELTHAMEDVLDQVRADRLGMTDALGGALFESVDLLRAQIPECLAGRTHLMERERSLIERLRSLRASGTGANAAPATPAQTESGGRRDTSLRVDLSTLDRLLDLSGEIEIARGRVTELIGDNRTSRAIILEAHQEAGRLHVEMQELVMKLRMVPIGRMLRQFHRTVRDLARSVGKRAELIIDGEDVAVDMKVIESLRDPLVHMIRNAIDHGIEDPARREEAGKPAIGRLQLRCSREEGSIVIELRDDGAGLDRAKILRRAREAGLVADESAIGDAEIEQLIFRPGFSTADEVTSLSGRGVGMDVVRRNIESIQGVISVRSACGAGTSVRIRLPLTLAIVEGLLIEAGGHPYVIPMEAVVEVLECRRALADPSRAGALFDFRGRVIPYTRLTGRFGVLSVPGKRGESLVVVRHEAGAVGLVVDRVLGECQTVVKPLAPIFRGMRGFSGASILPNGRIAFILDLPTLLREEWADRATPGALAPELTQRSSNGAPACVPA